MYLDMCLEELTTCVTSPNVFHIIINNATVENKLCVIKYLYMKCPDLFDEGIILMMIDILNIHKHEDIVVWLNLLIKDKKNNGIFGSFDYII